MDLTTIEACVRVAGLHHWPDAHEGRAYLRAPHRHMFVARAEVLVVHENREVEFHDLGDDLRTALHGANDRLTGGPDEVSLYDFGARSCEALAAHCFEQLAGRGYPVVRVSVSEDDEFTATVYGTDAPELTDARAVTERRIPDPARIPGQEPTA